MNQMESANKKDITILSFARNWRSSHGKDYGFSLFVRNFDSQYVK